MGNPFHVDFGWMGTTMNITITLQIRRPYILLLRHNTLMPYSSLDIRFSVTIMQCRGIVQRQSVLSTTGHTRAASLLCGLGAANVVNSQEQTR